MKRYTVKRLICTIDFLFLACCVVAQSSLTGTVRGLIKSNGDALEDATVYMGKTSMRTNQAGEFIIVVKPGIYKLTISYTGYQSIEQQVTVIENEIKDLNFNLEKSSVLEEIRILGSRSAVKRSHMNTAVPIDIITSQKLPQFYTNIAQQLALVVPSFNAPPQGIGTSTAINPATLRGLGPDETLVLLNGRRRHTSANIFLQYGLGYGTVATDLNTIPSAAIEKIQVLRDGAAAQYGSDAIAGVIDVELKNTIGKTSLNLNLGELYKGDGQTVSFDVNRGFKLRTRNISSAENKNGFLNVTASIRLNNPTYRNGAYDSTVYYNIPPGSSAKVIDSIKILDSKMVMERGFNKLTSRRIGNPKILNTSLVFNASYPLTKKTNLFGTGTMNYRFIKDEGSPVYRYPKDTTTVIKELYPDGFEPYTDVTIIDGSILAGIEGRMDNGWNWDLSSTYGGNSVSFDELNTNNASQFLLGTKAQTRFFTGLSGFSQNTSNVNFTRNFGNHFNNIKSLTSSFGAELRIEHYYIREGEEASWQNYAPASGRIPGSQGVPGVLPSVAINKMRYISAAFAELEMDKNEKLLWNTAARYERYSDFGGNLCGKLAIRYKFSDRLLIRGSFSNGFRAPALQQRYFSAINQMGGRNNAGIITTGTYRYDSEIASAFGIPPLKAEKSVNLSIGITSKISNHINLTLDAYWIQIKDRVIITGAIQRNPLTPGIGRILDSLSRKDIDAVRFFTNAINTRTKGADLVISGNWKIRKSLLEISLSANVNKTTIFGTKQTAKRLPDDSTYQNVLINMEERGRLEKAQPPNKIILAVNIQSGKLAFGARCNHFGKTAHLFAGDDRARDEYFSPKNIVGINIGYSITRWATINVGAGNIFNVYPDKLKNRKNTQAGLLIYDTNGTQIGYNGGYGYMRMECNW